MANIFFIKPFLNALQEGKSVRFGIFILLWVIAVAILIGGLVNWVDFWNQVSNQDAAGVFGVILYQLINLVLLYLIFQIIVIRASDVLNVEAYDSEFTIIPIMSVLTRTFGEIIAVICVVMGIGWMIFAWFAGNAPSFSGLGQFDSLLGAFGFISIISGTGFKAGILALVSGIVWSFIVIVVSYFWAEMIILGLKVYLNIKKIRVVSDGYDKSVPASTEAPKAPPAS